MAAWARAIYQYHVNGTDTVGTVGQSVGQSVGRLVGRLVGRSVGWSMHVVP